jgi:acetone carboxylase gamma subunit
MRIGEVIWKQEEHCVSCANCDTRLSADDENWKEHALVKRTNAAKRLNGGEFGPTYRVYEHPDLELAEIFCPACKTLLTVELYLRDEPLRWTYRSLSAAARSGYDVVADFAAHPNEWISFGASR